MLIEFRVANHRSIREEQALSMEAGRVVDASDPRPRQLPGYKDKLLTVAALYGANASGKSNMLSALAFMRDAVVSSYRNWPPLGAFPRQPFAWGDFAQKPSLFEVVLLINGIKYRYGFAASNDAIVEEWLYAWPKGKKQTWFTREGSSISFGDHLKGETKVVQNITQARPNALVLSIAVQNGLTDLFSIYSWFFYASINTQADSVYVSALVTIAQNAGQSRITAYNNLRPNEPYNLPSYDEIVNLLKQADFGIEGYRSEMDVHDSHDGGTGIKAHSGEIKIYLKHSSTYGENAWLPLKEESQGTRTFFSLSPHILQSLSMGSAFVVDELERSLHPALAQKIVELYNNPRSNPKNAQLIFTTHDTNLLGNTVGEPALRRDQVWLTEKDKTGATVLYPLTDFKPRKPENLERGYLQGRYGAVPILSWILTEGAPNP